MMIYKCKEIFVYIKNFKIFFDVLMVRENINLEIKLDIPGLNEDQ